MREDPKNTVVSQTQHAASYTADDMRDVCRRYPLKMTEYVACQLPYRLSSEGLDGYFLSTDKVPETAYCKDIYLISLAHSHIHTLRIHIFHGRDERECTNTHTRTRTHSSIYAIPNYFIQKIT